MPGIKYRSGLVSALNIEFKPTLVQSVEAMFSNLSRPKDYVEEIQGYLVKGERAYIERNYAQSIHYFTKTRQLIAGLIIDQPQTLNGLVDPPATAETEKLLIEAGLKFVEASKYDVKTYSSPINVQSIKEIPASLKAYEKLGFRPQDADGVRVQKQVAQGITLIDNGDFNEAASILQTEFKRLGDPQSKIEHAFRGSVALALSVAYLGLGNLNTATKAVQKAENDFKEAKDILGEAQALHNKGIALRRRGNNDKALEAFKASLSKYNKLTSRKAVEVNPQNPRLPTPGTSRIPQPIFTKPITTVPLSTRVQGTVADSSNDMHAIDYLGESDSNIASLRFPGLNGGVGGIHIPQKVKTISKNKSWTFGVLRGKEVVLLKWNNNRRPSVAVVEKSLYKKRIKATAIRDIICQTMDSIQLSIWLSHLYHFAIPQRLGDAYHYHGNYTNAEAYYLVCARYSYLNIPIEAPSLWGRMAKNYAAWGDSLWKTENIAECKTKYSQIILNNGNVPNSSFMFSEQKLKGPAQKAHKLIDALNAGNSVAIDPVIGIPIYDIWARWQYLNAGLDFFGTTFQPSFIYDYLREVALGFVNQAIRAEQEYIDFQTNAEAETAQRQQLETLRGLAKKDKVAATEMFKAAYHDYLAADIAKKLAEERKKNAANAKTEYLDVAWWQERTETIAMMSAAGKNIDWGVIENLAKDMTGSSWSIHDWQEGVAAAKMLGGKKNRDYEAARMQDAIDELTIAETVAESQKKAALARHNAADWQKKATELRYDRTKDALTAFNKELFTPELWEEMAKVMLDISQAFKNRAIQAAKLMEHAYNFEMDTVHRVIDSSYMGVGTKGLLGSDMLLTDIESFVHRYVTEQQTKESHIKEVISLTAEYPMHMHTFRKTGEIAFETRLYDFDRLHPGFYRQRLHAVEVEIVGLLPPEGVNGTLSSGLISQYRTDADENGEPGAKTRVHGMDTMALSEFEVRRDGLLFRMDQRKLGLFEGQGIAASWKFQLPKRSNNLDYRLITDIRLVLYYSALHSSRLEDAIEKQPPLPGEMVRSREFLLRYAFPVSWYAFQDTGDLAFDILARHLPRNQENFVIEKLTLMVITSEGASAKGLTCKLKLPGKPEKSVLLDETGNIAERPSNNLNTVIGGNLDGNWQVSLEPKPGSDLADEDDKLKGKLIEQIAVVLEYSFKWVE